MNPTIKQQWVEALRSGAYAQGKGYLRTRAGFCCLGVLCDLHSKATGEAWNPPWQSVEAYVYMGTTWYLPEAVQKWAGLSDGNPHITTAREITNLPTLNDTQVPFPEIADAIEASPL